jgi:hypothetical protein
VGWARAAAKQSPRPPTTHRKEFLDGQPTHPRPGPTRPPDPNRHAVVGDRELLEHLRTPAAFGGHEFTDWPVDQITNGFGGDLDARHRHDHTRLSTEFTHTHSGLQRDPVRDREAALALGVRVAVHISRQNDPNPVIWQPG